MSNINSCIFENLADENYGDSATSSSNKGFYKPEQPENHRKRREKRERERE